jgi:hypothetical protein
VGDSQLRSLAQSVDAKVAHTSAATGQGVAELFQMVAEDLAGSLEAEVRRGGAGSSAVTEPEVVLHRCPPPLPWSNSNSRYNIFLAQVQSTLAGE